MAAWRESASLQGRVYGGLLAQRTPEFELWLEAERVRWRGAFGELCERVSRLQAEEGRLEEATKTTWLWTRYASLDEAAHLRLMELLSAAGDSEGALLAYEDFRSVLRESLRSSPPNSRWSSLRVCERKSRRGLLWTQAWRLSVYYFAFSTRGPVCGAPCRVWRARFRVPCPLREGTAHRHDRGGRDR